MALYVASAQFPSCLGRAALLIIMSLQVRSGAFRGTCHSTNDRRLYRRIRDELEVALLGPVYFRLSLRSRR
jgi:hypothetical protein